jgi:hypothetical protein
LNLPVDFGKNRGRKKWAALDLVGVIKVVATLRPTIADLTFGNFRSTVCSGRDTNAPGTGIAVAKRSRPFK